MNIGDEHPSIPGYTWTEIAGKGLWNKDTSNGGTEDYMNTSVLNLSQPTPTSIQVDATLSEWNGDAVGGTLGSHYYSIEVLKSTLDITAGDTPVPTTAGLNVDFDGTYYKKNISGNAWNSWFKSTNPIIDPATENAAVTWEVEGDHDSDGADGDDGTIREMGGLDNNPDQNQSYSSIDFALYQVNGNLIYIYESGAYKNSYTVPMDPGDRLGVKVEQGVVSYFHLRGTTETVVHVSDTVATDPLYFKGTLNRGNASSGASVMGDVRKHNTLIPTVVTETITGGAASAISSVDQEKLVNLGLTILPGSTYGQWTADKLTSSIFPSGTVYEIIHSYFVMSNQTNGTI